MTKRYLSTVATLAALAVAAPLLTAAAPAPATARSQMYPAAEVVNVSVGFNSQVPLSDLSEEALAAAQKSARKYLYRMARDECAVLETIIAKSCRLTNLNINTQIQYPHQHGPTLYVNGNANFAIGLKTGGEL